MFVRVVRSGRTVCSSAVPETYTDVFVSVFRFGWAVCSSAVSETDIHVFVGMFRSGWAVSWSGVSDACNYPCVCECGQVWLGCLFVCCF